MKHLILLHGAIGASSQMIPIAEQFRPAYTVHIPDFSGHGGQPMPEGVYSIPLFANEVLAYMDKHEIKQADFFGYSMGGYVAMYIARHYPDRAGKIVTLATKYDWDEATAAKEVQMLDAAKIEAKIPAFAATLKERHNPNNWQEVLQRTSAMLMGLGVDNPLKSEDYSGINHQVLVLLGDRDKMVTLDETVRTFKALPNAAMGVVPNTHHPIEQVNMPVLVHMIRTFLT